MVVARAALRAAVSAGAPPPMTDEPIRCSFCEQASEAARIIVTSKTAAICDNCIDRCLDLLIERNGYTVAFPRLHRLWVRRVRPWFSKRRG
jgi:ClpX C4-type zinc finger